MFIDSCKKLKIMKGSDAIGLGILKYFMVLLTTNFTFVAYMEVYTSGSHPKYYHVVIGLDKSQSPDRKIRFSV